MHRGHANRNGSELLKDLVLERLAGGRDVVLAEAHLQDLTDSRHERNTEHEAGLRLAHFMVQSWRIFMEIKLRIFWIITVFLYYCIMLVKIISERGSEKMGARERKSENTY